MNAALANSRPADTSCAAMSFTPPDANTRVEFGNEHVSQTDSAEKSSLVLASYNIRYAVGRFLILSGLLRKFGYNFPGRRADAIERNLAAAAATFTNNRLLPAPDILALQEADKMTGRTARRHIARSLAEEMKMSYVHAGVGLPLGIQPKQREWWLNFEEQVGSDDKGDMGVAWLSRMPLTDVELIDLPW